MSAEQRLAELGIELPPVSDVTTEEAAAHARQVGIKAIFEVE